MAFMRLSFLKLPILPRNSMLSYSTKRQTGDRMHFQDQMNFLNLEVGFSKQTNIMCLIKMRGNI